MITSNFVTVRIDNKRMESEEVEYNIYHYIANGCTKQGMLNCFIFELRYYTASTELFQRMKTVEILYEGYRETYQT